MMECAAVRTILAACIALSAVALPAVAQVTVTTGPTPYWREHSDWQSRGEFRGDQYQKEAWSHDHCVRDWQGHEYCRR
jgi:hypothetical protein